MMATRWPEVDGEIVTTFKKHAICVERKRDHENWLHHCHCSERLLCL